jgi:hypothetical protein
MFESGPIDPRTAILEFKQAANTRTEGQVAGTNTSFDPLRLPATFKVGFGASDICTATLVGPKVILTAAHCVDLREEVGNPFSTILGSLTLANEENPRRFKACQMAEAYVKAPVPKKRVPRNAKDWALCELRSRIDLQYENLTLDSGKVAGGRPIMIAGFGCTEANLYHQQIRGDELSDGVLSVGDNVLEAGLTEGWLTSLGRIGSKAAVICPGDSGGAAFFDAATNDVNDKPWRVAAVNSAVGPSPRSDAKPEDHVSYLSSLADPDFLILLEGFVAKDPQARAVCRADKPANLRCRR